MRGWVILSAAEGWSFSQIDIWFYVGLEAALPFCGTKSSVSFPPTEAPAMGTMPKAHSVLLTGIELDRGGAAYILDWFMGGAA